MGNLPLEVRLEVALEDCHKAKVGEAYSITDYDLWGRRSALLFASGAEKVEDRGITYRKVYDKAHFDNGIAVRELVYKRK